MSHYKIELPALIAFSGGRTSGYMLRQVLDAFNGQPKELYVLFCNTGEEQETQMACTCTD